MQISPAASTPPATQYHRRDGRIGRLPAAVACPPEVIIRLPASRSYLTADQDHSSLPPHYHSGKADRPGRSAIRPAPPLPRSWVPDISRGSSTVTNQISPYQRSRGHGSSARPASARNNYQETAAVMIAGTVNDKPAEWSKYAINRTTELMSIRLRDAATGAARHNNGIGIRVIGEHVDPQPGWRSRRGRCRRRGAGQDGRPVSWRGFLVGLIADVFSSLWRSRWWLAGPVVSWRR